MKIIRTSFVTLIEMMIVMFLIAMILGIVAINYRGTLDKGRAFKTQAGIEKLQAILNLAIAENPSLDLTSEQAWHNAVERSPLVQNPNTLFNDGWGIPYIVEVQDGKIIVISRRYEEYMRSQGNGS